MHIMAFIQLLEQQRMFKMHALLGHIVLYLVQVLLLVKDHARLVIIVQIHQLVLMVIIAVFVWEQ
jgi:hypothetical protein